MSWQQCIAEVEAAAGRALTEQEMSLLAVEVEHAANLARQSKRPYAEALAEGVKNVQDRIKTVAAISRRNAIWNLRRRVVNEQYIMDTWGHDPAKGLQATDVGVQSARRGARRSAAAEQEQLADYYTGGFMADVEKTGFVREFASGEFDLQIRQAAAELAKEAPDLSRFQPEVVALARALDKWNEAARLDANNAGAWIGKLDGYVVKQTHDTYKIRGVSMDEWRAEMLNRLDLERSFGDADNVIDALNEMYTSFAAGVHVQAPKGGPTPLKGFGNLGRSLSHERVLHFKTPADEHAYFTRFGIGANLAESMLHGLTRMARNTGLMRVWGPNAAANREAVINAVMRRLKQAQDPKALRKFESAIKTGEHNFAHISGASHVVGNHMIAQVAQGVRVVETTAKLGGAVLSAASDIPLYASEMKYQGRGFLTGMAEAIGGLLRGKTTAEQRELGAMLGVFMDHMRGSVAGRFNAEDGLPAVGSKLTMRFFKMNGLQWWTDRLRLTASLAMSHMLARVRNTNWQALNPDLQRVLGLYNIDEGKWAIMGRAGAKALDGRDYLVPEAIRDIPDEAFHGYLTGRGEKPTRSAVGRLKAEMESDLRSYFIDRANTANILPDARTKAFLLRGSRPGTAEGEFWRFVAQFKAFPVAVLQKVVGREIYGRGSDTLAQALRNGNGEMAGLAQLLVWNTLFGYGAKAAKDAVRGRTPRVPRDAESALKIVIASMVQGGALGIYGDFLFGEMQTRGGHSVVGTLAGPTANTLEDLWDLKNRLWNGEPAAGRAFRVAMNHTPFLNLFYTRMALDYLFLYRVSETLSPGYLRRMERNLKNYTDQRYFVPPSTVVPYGG